MTSAASRTEATYRAICGELDERRAEIDRDRRLRLVAVVVEYAPGGRPRLIRVERTSERAIDDDHPRPPTMGDKTAALLAAVAESLQILRGELDADGTLRSLTLQFKFHQDGRARLVTHVIASERALAQRNGHAGP